MKIDLAVGSLLCFPGRFLSSNIYVIMTEGKAVAVDSGMPWTAKSAAKYLEKNNVELEYILMTHGHFDHVMGLNTLKRLQETKVVAYVRGRRGDLKVRDGDVLGALGGKLNFLIFYTGVHTSDHVWYLETNTGILFVGDLLPTLRDLAVVRKRGNVRTDLILPGHGEAMSLGT